MDFSTFIKQNKEKIYKFADSNTPKNKQGITVIKKDDEWRNEPEWDDLYEDIKH